MFSVLKIVLLCMCVVAEAAIFKREANQCGIEASSNLIHHNPWLVYLEYYRDDSQWEIMCAATLISERHAVTAAHCVKPRFSRLVARLGEYDVYSKVDCVRGVCADPIVRIDVEEVTIHPGYDGSEHDIAILTLKEKAPYTDFIRPVCLPTGEFGSDAVFSAAGWGEIPAQGAYSHVKKIIPLPFWSKEKCQASYKHNVVPEHVICAGGVEDVDTCRGDSGGPLTLIKDKTELWGVTSAGNTHCGTKNSPGFYTNVAHHLDWIKNIIA